MPTTAKVSNVTAAGLIPGSGMTARRPTARMTVRTTIYYQQPGSQAILSEPRYCRLVDSEEVPYVHPLYKVGPEWASLPQGWLEKPPGLVVVENPGDATVEIGVFVPPPSVVVDLWEGTIVVTRIVRPKEGDAFEPPDYGKLRIRCPGGPSKVNLTLYPG